MSVAALCICRRPISSINNVRSVRILFSRIFIKIIQLNDCVNCSWWSRAQRQGLKSFSVFESKCKWCQEKRLSDVRQPRLLVALFRSKCTRIFIHIINYAQRMLSGRILFEHLYSHRQSTIRGDLFQHAVCTIAKLTQ